MTLPTDLYGALHHARESLCIAQVHVEWLSYRAELQQAVDTIDRIGTSLCPQWSKDDLASQSATSSPQLDQRGPIMELEQLLANAKGIGSFVGCVAIEAAGLLSALRQAHAALEAGDVERAKLVLGNQLAPGTTFHIEAMDLAPSQPMTMDETKFDPPVWFYPVAMIAVSLFVVGLLFYGLPRA